MSIADILPLMATAEPATQDELVAAIANAYASDTAIYPIGGATCLDYGLPARRGGLGLHLSKLNRVVDYPARDMTITVEAGITLAALAAELAREGQRLPIDAAQADRATLGGLIATNFSGPRRLGHGTVRDYVIGIRAVDGRGTQFNGGGRVVKNVAGYDFCKLLTGSLGTLAIISQVTLKVRPLAPATAIVACDADNWQRAESLLAGLVTSRTTPVAIELLAGPAWCDQPGLGTQPGTAARLVVGFEGTGAEVEWQVGQLTREWREQQVGEVEVLRQASAFPAWFSLVEFAGNGSAPLVMKASLPPSAVVPLMQLFLEVDPGCSLQAHAASGAIVARFAQFSSNDAGSALVQKLQPAAAAAGGSVVVWSCLVGELTRQATWGAPPAAAAVMRAVKDQFDPKGLLNPGRFWFVS
jgi:glycolate oxidase FAD binding subunit